MKTTLFQKDLFAYYFFLIGSLAFIFFYNQPESFLIINRIHCNFLDKVMPYFTLLGDGITIVLLSLLFSLLSVRYSIFLLMGYATSGIAVQLLKRFVFADRLRPLAYFRDTGMEIYTIPGLDIPLKHSFPSGHTASAFAFFVGLSFIVRNKYLKLALLLIAVIIGFSRVYVAAHFPVDVIAGSLIGVLAAYICFIWILRWKKSWLDVSLKAIILKAFRK